MLDHSHLIWVIKLVLMILSYILSINLTPINFSTKPYTKLVDRITNWTMTQQDEMNKLLDCSDQCAATGQKINIDQYSWHFCFNWDFSFFFFVHSILIWVFYKFDPNQNSVLEKWIGFSSPFLNSYMVFLPFYLLDLERWVSRLYCRFLFFHPYIYFLDMLFSLLCSYLETIQHTSRHWSFQTRTKIIK